MAKETKKMSVEKTELGSQEENLNESPTIESSTSEKAGIIRIQEVMADRYISLLQEIAVKFNEWMKKSSEFHINITPDKVFDAFRLDFKKIREEFQEYMILTNAPYSNTEKSEFVSSFNAWLDEWHSFIYGKRMSDGQGFSDHDKSLFVINESNELILPEESENSIRERFDQMIQTEEGARLAELQEELRKNILELYQMFEGKEGTADYPFFLTLTPKSILNMFVFTDRSSKMEIFSKNLEYDQLFTK